MAQEQLNEAKTRMQKAIEALRHELATVRTGRASPGLVEHLRVDYYGTPTPLNQLATITTPDAKLIVIQPYDRSALGAVEKAILKSDLGLTPSNDGTVIRLAIPALTEERRKDLVKHVRRRAQRPLPSMMMATWRGACNSGRGGGVSTWRWVRAAVAMLSNSIERFSGHGGAAGAARRREALSPCPHPLCLSL